MRVTGGKLKGRRLKGVKKTTVTRAVTDSIKESIFAILGDISGRKVLDLFAGTGSFGIEALSRGAEKAVFIDCDRDSVKTVRENLESLGLNAVVSTGDVMKRLKKLASKFDLVFIDPPFSSNLAVSALEELSNLKLVSVNGDVVVRCHHKRFLPEKVGRFQLERSERYGENSMYLYSMRGG